MWQKVPDKKIMSYWKLQIIFLTFWTMDFERAILLLSYVLFSVFKLRAKEGGLKFKNMSENVYFVYFVCFLN